MSATVEETYEAPKGKYLVDFYGDWARAEGVPVHESAGVVDLATAAVADWKRFGTKGAVAHLAGHCDFLTVFLLELSSAWSAPQKHLYEEICYVLSGAGETEIDLGGGRKNVIAWKPGSLFAAPMNATYRHRASGGGARIVAFNDLRYLINLYRNETFLFATPVNFPERGDGEVAHDLPTMPIGAGVWQNERATAIALAKGSIGADAIDIPAGAYGQARRQVFGSTLLCIAGEGMTVSWEDADGPRVKTMWKAGSIFAPQGIAFHQHFNLGASPARLLRVEYGTAETPLVRPRMRAYGDTSVYASGLAEIAYKDEAPELKRDWLELLKQKGVQSRM